MSLKWRGFIRNGKNEMKIESVGITFSKFPYNVPQSNVKFLQKTR